MTRDLESRIFGKPLSWFDGIATPEDLAWIGRMETRVKACEKDEEQFDYSTFTEADNATMERLCRLTGEYESCPACGVVKKRGSYCENAPDW